MVLQGELFGGAGRASRPVKKIDKGLPSAAISWSRPEERGPYWYAARVGSAPGGITARIHQSALSGRLVLVIEWPARTGCPAAEYVASVEDGMARAAELLPQFVADQGGAHG